MDKEDRQNFARGMSIIKQLAISALICVVLGVLIGYWLDRWLGLSPLFLIVFSLLGVASAIKVMIDIAKKI